MSTSSYRVGMIGAGDTANWRARALQAAGLEITAVASRPGSARVGAFGERFGIPHVFTDGWSALLERRELWDALAIATWPDGTPEVLAAALETDVPILVEKPVAWTSATLATLCAAAHERVMVGYNRRFYPSVQRARAEARSGPPLLAQLVLPVVPEPADPTRDYIRPFFESVNALGLDLTRFVLGDLRVDAVRRLADPTGKLIGIAALLASERGDLVQLTGNWDAPANFSLTLNRAGRRLELLPFEIASIYEGMEVLPASDEYPIRRYVPKRIECVTLEGDDLREKPGFLGEARALRNLMDGAQPAFAARLEDALAVTRLCEELSGWCY